MAQDYKGLPVTQDPKSLFSEMNREGYEDSTFDQGVLMAVEGQQANNSEQFWQGVALLVKSNSKQKDLRMSGIQVIAELCLAEFRENTTPEHLSLALKCLSCFALELPSVTQWLFRQDIFGLVSDRFMSLDPACRISCAKVLGSVVRDSDAPALSVCLEKIPMETLGHWIETSPESDDLAFVMYWLWLKCGEALSSSAPQLANFVAENLKALAHVQDTKQLTRACYFLNIERLLCTRYAKPALTRLCTDTQFFLALGTLFSSFHSPQVTTTVLDIWTLLISKVKGNMQRSIIAQLPFTLFAKMLGQGVTNDIVLRIFHLIEAIITRSEGMVSYIIESNMLDFICVQYQHYAFRERVACCKLFISLFNHATRSEAQQLTKQLHSLFVPLLDIITCDDEDLQKKSIDSLAQIFETAQRCNTFESAKSAFLALNGLEALESVSSDLRSYAERFVETFQLAQSHHLTPV